MPPWEKKSGSLEDILPWKITWNLRIDGWINKSTCFFCVGHYGSMQPPIPRMRWIFRGKWPKMTIQPIELHGFVYPKWRLWWPDWLIADSIRFINSLMDETLIFSKKNLLNQTAKKIKQVPFILQKVNLSAPVQPPRGLPLEKSDSGSPSVDDIAKEVVRSRNHPRLGLEEWHKESQKHCSSSHIASKSTKYYHISSNIIIKHQTSNIIIIIIIIIIKIIIIIIIKIIIIIIIMIAFFFTTIPEDKWLSFVTLVLQIALVQ